MKYTLPNGKTVNIPDAEIKSSMLKYELSEQEAIQLYLEDNDLDIGEEYAQALEKTKGYKVEHGASAEKTEKAERKPHIVQVSDTKKAVFQTILTNLQQNFGENVKVEKENKLIIVEIDGKTLKIDLIEQRPKKK